MLTDSFVDAFNSRIQVNVNTVKSMTASQLDRIKALGNQAEELMKNKDLAMFVHSTRIELLDAITSVTGHSEETNNHRIALSNQLSGLEAFIDQLKRAVYNRNLVVKQQAQGGATPTDII